MTKNQKTLLGVGVLAVAGYLVWKNQQKKSFVGKRNAAGTIPSGGQTFTGKPCKKSPANYMESTLTTAQGDFPAGTPIYECCGIGVWGTVAGPTPCANKATTITLLQQAGKGF